MIFLGSTDLETARLYGARAADIASKFKGN
jgi:hypothetical protein